MPHVPAPAQNPTRDRQPRRVLRGVEYQGDAGRKAAIGLSRQHARRGVAGYIPGPADRGVDRYRTTPNGAGHVGTRDSRGLGLTMAQQVQAHGATGTVASWDSLKPHGGGVNTDLPLGYTPAADILAQLITTNGIPQRATTYAGRTGLMPGSPIQPSPYSTMLVASPAPRTARWGRAQSDDAWVQAARNNPIPDLSPSLTEPFVRLAAPHPGLVHVTSKDGVPSYTAPPALPIGPPPGTGYEAIPVQELVEVPYSAGGVPTPDGIPVQNAKPARGRGRAAGWIVGGIALALCCGRKR